MLMALKTSEFNINEANKYASLVNNNLKVATFMKPYKGECFNFIHDNEIYVIANIEQTTPNYFGILSIVIGLIIYIFKGTLISWWLIFPIIFILASFMCTLTFVKFMFGKGAKKHICDFIVLKDETLKRILYDNLKENFGILPVI
jgi:hypothetical protein